MNEVITISLKEYKELKYNSLVLNALYIGGEDDFELDKKY